MTLRKNIASLAGLMLAGSLAASPLAAARAAAQEAIMLETIGAVRMARPDEVKRMSDADVRAQRGSAAVAAPERHAAVVE